MKKFSDKFFEKYTIESALNAVKITKENHEKICAYSRLVSEIMGKD